jgi:hypothetical protein
MTDQPRSAAECVAELIAFFIPQCSETETLDELHRHAVPQRKLLRECHSLFGRIREKTLRAEKTGDTRLLAQYSFEELCAKALYNLSWPNDGFRPDSAFWLLPVAADFAHVLGHEDPMVVWSAAFGDA